MRCSSTSFSSALGTNTLGERHGTVNPCLRSGSGQSDFETLVVLFIGLDHDEIGYARVRHQNGEGFLA